MPIQRTPEQIAKMQDAREKEGIDQLLVTKNFGSSFFVFGYKPSHYPFGRNTYFWVECNPRTGEICDGDDHNWKTWEEAKKKIYLDRHEFSDMIRLYREQNMADLETDVSRLPVYLSLAAAEKDLGPLENVSVPGNMKFITASEITDDSHSMDFCLGVRALELGADALVDHHYVGSFSVRATPMRKKRIVQPTPDPEEFSKPLV